MQQLLYFIQKFKYLLYFILLQLVALFLVFNNHNFHRSKFISSANVFSGYILEKSNGLRDYLRLKSLNTNLVEENKKLKNQLNGLVYSADSLHETFVNDSVEFKQQFVYINGKLIKNEFHKSDNFLLINRGIKHNINKEMAVVNDKGIVGITDNVSNRYARIQSILNSKSRVNARFKNNFYFGTLVWNGKDYNVVQLTDIPRQAVYSVGDTIITGGKSTIFPEGVPIGTVLKKPVAISASNVIDVKLFNDMSNLGYVYVIKNFHKQEITELENNSNE